MSVRPRDLRLTVVGLPGSGKTSLLGAFGKGMRGPAGPGGFDLALSGELLEVRARMAEVLASEKCAKWTPPDPRTWLAEVDEVGRDRRKLLRLACTDTSGAELANTGPNLVEAVRDASLLLICVRLGTEGIARTLGTLTRVLARIAETQSEPIAQRARWWPWPRQAPVDVHHQRFGARRVLLALTGCEALLEGRPAHEIRSRIARLDPVAEGVRALGPDTVFALRRLARDDADFAVALTSAWGFCVRTGAPYLAAQSDPAHLGHRANLDDRIRDWVPFGVPEALGFLVTGAAVGPTCRFEPALLRDRFGPIPPPRPHHE